MARALGPRKIHRYSEEFKATAVKLSTLPGVEVQAVAEALDIHPFMLSRWRKEVREGRIIARAKPVDIESKPAAELRLDACAAEQKRFVGDLHFHRTGAHEVRALDLTYVCRDREVP